MSTNVQREDGSTITPEACESLIGKTIAKVTAEEYRLTLTFTDGSELQVRGYTEREGPLRVESVPS